MCRRGTRRQRARVSGTRAATMCCLLVHMRFKLRFTLRPQVHGQKSVACMCHIVRLQVRQHVEGALLPTPCPGQISFTQVRPPRAATGKPRRDRKAGHGTHSPPRAKAHMKHRRQGMHTGAPCCKLPHCADCCCGALSLPFRVTCALRRSSLHTQHSRRPALSLRQDCAQAARAHAVRI